MRQLLKSIAAGVGAVMISFGAHAQEFTWNLANHYPATEFQSEAMQMFADSLHAALTVAEVAELLQQVGLPAEWVRATSDRHWTISGTV